VRQLKALLVRLLHSVIYFNTENLSQSAVSQEVLVLVKLGITTSYVRRSVLSFIKIYLLKLK